MSLVSYKHRFVFVHIPKTGGSSVRAALYPYARIRDRIAYEWPTRFLVTRLPRLYPSIASGRELVTGLRKHATFSQIRDSVGELVEVWAFAFVRNPWDWYVSRYYYIKRSLSHPLHSIANRCTFTEFLATTSPPSSQLQYITLPDRRISVDFVGRFECLTDDFRHITHSLGLDNVQLPHLNRSQARPSNYRQMYNAWARREIERIFSDDIEVFRYTF